MKSLGTAYKKNTFYFEQVERQGQIAIFKQRLRPGVGCLAFEVIRIREEPERIIQGVTIPAHERAPGNEEWGRHGWTYPTIDDARAKMRALVAEAKEP